jgi:hypothetical protein
MQSGIGNTSIKGFIIGKLYYILVARYSEVVFLVGDLVTNQPKSLYTFAIWTF